MRMQLPALHAEIAPLCVLARCEEVVPLLRIFEGSGVDNPLLPVMESQAPRVEQR